MKLKWKQTAQFYERADRLKLHGLHFQHVALCERRAWMYMHHVNFAQWYGRVQTGTSKHATTYARDHSTQGLMGLAPDRIDWENCVVYENKGTGGAKEAADLQTAFYALMLSIATGRQWKGITHVLSTKKRREVPLNEEQLQKLWDASERLEILAATANVPYAERIGLCDSCSLAGFCGYD